MKFYTKVKIAKIKRIKIELKLILRGKHENQGANNDKK